MKKINKINRLLQEIEVMLKVWVNQNQEEEKVIINFK